MADYNFGLFSCLVVDDSSYLRTLISSSLRAIGVGNIKTADDGGQAIEFLQTVRDDPMKAGMQHVDMIFSNWQMNPVDGMMLLRWVRRHKESPNRFVPFVMVTGYADREKVREARAMGVTEMLAKPFSVVNLAQRLLQVVDRPRKFVHTAEYFGPDRRRTQREIPPGKDRRKINERDVEVIHV
ncbi:MAG: response regulator [Alphaproteobacteria bacterium]|nr:response regulator [Alphaproteobacteria bacterium]